MNILIVLKLLIEHFAMNFTHQNMILTTEVHMAVFPADCAGETPWSKNAFIKPIIPTQVPS